MSYTPSCVGIDVKARKLNIAVVRGQRVEYQDEALLGAGNDVKLGGRDVSNAIGAMQNAIDRLAQHCDHPALVVLEKPFTDVKSYSVAAIELFHATMVRLEMYLHQSQMVPEWVAVSTWRKQVLGNGRMNTALGKQKAIEYCELVYGIKAANDDAADAIALATYGAQKQRRLAVAS